MYQNGNIKCLFGLEQFSLGWDDGAVAPSRVPHSVKCGPQGPVGFSLVKLQ